MSNPRPLVFVCLFAAWADAQSPELLEGLRLQQPWVTDRARQELTACRAGNCDALVRLTMLVGVLELSDNQPQRARELLISSPAPVGLEHVHAWYLAQAEVYSGSVGDAVKRLEPLVGKSPPWLQRRVVPRLGELQLRQGDAKAALPWLTKGDPGPEITLSLAEAYWALGNKAKATAAYRRLLIHWPAHPHASFAEQRLGLAWLPKEARVERAAGWLEAGEAQRAMTELEGIKSPALADRVALIQGRACLALGRENEGLESINRAAKNTGVVGADAKFLLARRLMRAGHDTAALEAFTKLAKAHPQTQSADEATYLAAWLKLKVESPAAAVAAFTAYEEQTPRSRRRDEARWYRAHAQIKGKLYADARATLQSLMLDFPNSSMVPQAMYWIARSHELEGVLSDEARRTYSAVVATYAGHYYALLAAERLRAVGPVPEVTWPRPIEPNTALEVPECLKLASALARTGLFHDAAEEVRRIVGQTPAKDALSVGEGLLSMGEFGPGHTLAARHLWRAAYVERDARALGLMYPQAFAQHLRNATNLINLSPAFAWAIMRRESTFRPEVISAAGARGLMQIIPPTASSIAAEVGDQPPPPDALYAPALNVRYGTWYLERLLKRLGHPALAAAAYNAGPTAVLGWIQQRGSLPLDQFVEEIPYKETRGYVKQVLGDLYLYATLYGLPAPAFEFTLPAPQASGVSF